MKTKKTKGAKSATKHVKRNATKQVTNVVSVESVESVNTTEVAVIASGKVTSKEVLKAASTIRAAVKEERRGANCTIRLIAARAAAGDSAAVDVLCALCDVPRAALYSLNIDTIRAAVNAYYPYFVETDGRKISVRPVGVWYSTANGNEEQTEAAKRVQRGFKAVAVADYLEQLIRAAKCRAKGVQPRRVDAEAIYCNIELSEISDGISAAEIDEAKKRRAYSPNAANVWHKHSLIGFYI